MFPFFLFAVIFVSCFEAMTIRISLFLKYEEMNRLSKFFFEKL